MRFCCRARFLCRFSVLFAALIGCKNTSYIKVYAGRARLCIDFEIFCQAVCLSMQISLPKGISHRRYIARGTRISQSPSRPRGHIACQCKYRSRREYRIEDISHAARVYHKAHHAREGCHRCDSPNKIRSDTSLRSRISSRRRFLHLWRIYSAKRI